MASVTVSLEPLRVTLLCFQNVFGAKTLNSLKQVNQTFFLINGIMIFVYPYATLPLVHSFNQREILTCQENFLTKKIFSSLNVENHAKRFLRFFRLELTGCRMN